MSGLALSNVTRPGPRYFDQVRTTAGGGFRSGALVPLVYFASSAAQTVSGMDADDEVERAGAFSRSPFGPWMAVPF